MLAERLKELEQNEIVERQVLPETPVKVIYKLTDKGMALQAVFQEMQNGQTVLRARGSANDTCDE